MGSLILFRLFSYSLRISYASTKHLDHIHPSPPTPHDLPPLKFMPPVFQSFKHVTCWIQLMLSIGTWVCGWPHAHPSKTIDSLYSSTETAVESLTSYSHSPDTFTLLPEPEGRGCVVDVSFGDGHSIVPCCLQFSAKPSVLCRKTLLQWGLRTALIGWV